MAAEQPGRVDETPLQRTWNMRYQAETDATSAAHVLQRIRTAMHERQLTDGDLRADLGPKLHARIQALGRVGARHPDVPLVLLLADYLHCQQLWLLAGRGTAPTRRTEVPAIRDTRRHALGFLLPDEVLYLAVHLVSVQQLCELGGASRVAVRQFLQDSRPVRRSHMPVAALAALRVEIRDLVAGRRMQGMASSHSWAPRWALPSSPGQAPSA